MRSSERLWPILVAGIPLLLVATSFSAVGLDDPLGLTPSETMHVQVVDQDRLGVVAGMVTVTERGPLGIGSSTTQPGTGWVVVHQQGEDLALSSLTVVQDNAFTDPNGATWLAQEVTDGEATAWVVPVGEPTHDPTLESTYNFAVVVDWGEVPEDTSLTASYVEDLDLS